MTLKLGISGVRGIAGGSLTEDVVKDLAKAFASYIYKGTVIVGRDPRPSGKKLEKILISCLISSGINVLNAGISATPTVQVLVKKLKAKGGIVITASHNPIEWNGLKFISSKGIFLNEEQNNKLFGIFRSKDFKESSKKGRSNKISDPDKYHIKAVLSNTDVRMIKAGKFKVVIDSCNGAGSLITPRLLKELGCRVIRINTDPKKPFPHGTEPIPQNLTDLCRTVREAGADIGFAQDPDADRLAVVSDKGIAVGEEYTLPLAAEYALSKTKNAATVVTNLSTSMMIDDVANKFGAKVLRTKVGEINVVERLVRSKALIGGEGNGGIIYPRVVSSRDSLTGIALILSLMAQKNMPISNIIDDIPPYYMLKTKIECHSKEEVEVLLNKIRSAFSNEKMDLQDGVKIFLNGLWVHVRPSNTEPVVRVIAEGRNKEEVIKAVNSLNG